MLKKRNRLSAHVRLKNPSVKNLSIATLRIAHNNLAYNRFAFVVSKKIDKRATVRNRIKRQIRFCIEQVLEQLEPGYDMLIIIRKEALQIDSKNYCSLVHQVLKKETLL